MRLQRPARRDAIGKAEPEFAETLGELRRVSLAHRIGDSVAEAIASDRLRCGDRLVEVKLAEQLGVSRVPVREALKVLHAQGILSGGTHRGYRVADFGPETAATVFETRLTVESLLLRDAIAAWRAGIGDPAALEAPLRQMALAAKMRDSLVSLRADIAFHSTIRDAARNAVAGILWDALARHVLIIFNRAPYRDTDHAAVLQHHIEFRNEIMAYVQAPTAPDLAICRQALEHHLLQVARRTLSAPASPPARKPRKVVTAARATV